MSTLMMDIEHASIRQNVKHGYILVWKNEEKRFSNMLGRVVSTYEHVVSWKIYKTKKLARQEIQRMLDAMTERYIANPDKWTKKDMDEKTALYTVIYKDRMGIK